MKDNFAQRIRKVLIKHNVIEDQKADEALALADKEDKLYCEVLLERNFVDELGLISALCIESSMPPIDVEKIKVEEDALEVISQEIASYYGVLPISKIGNILTIAISNPFDIVKLDDLRTVTNCDIRSVVSTGPAIKRAIQKAYKLEADKMDELLDDMEGKGSTIEVKETVEEEIDLSKLAEESGESPIVKFLNMLIVGALKRTASDIHIEPFEKTVRVRYRIDGILTETVSPPKSMHNAVISRVKIVSNLDIAERRVPQDGKFQVKYEGRQVDFRVSILPTIFGEKAVLRVLDSSTLNIGISQLGFEPEAEAAFRRAILASYGMVLVTGPTSSGKSTTLYASLREVLDPEENVITVEEPVEYQLEGVNQVPVNVKRGLTFATALRSIMRQDPDIIMIGEMRDLETADIAVKAAITGHLVLSTLHTNDAASSITRMVDIGIDRFMVAASVILVAAQRLLRKLCENCKVPLDPLPSKDELLKIGFKPEEIPNLKLWRPVGCPSCTNGYKGRFAVLEALEVTEDIKRLIIEGKSAIDVKKLAIEKHNMFTLRHTALINAMRGKTSLEEVLRMTMGDEF